jgi:ligand-binding sensor domain-containing protein
MTQPPQHNIFKFPRSGVRVLFILFLFSLTLTAAPHLSRNYAYRYFSTRDGLAQMQVLCAFQDRDGFMWFGTKGGVSRYDGISFRNYTQEDGIPVGEMFGIAEWGHKKVFHFNYQFQILHENDSLELVELPDSLLSTGGKVKSIEISNDEILLLNIIKPSETKFFTEYNTWQYHYVWNKKTRKFKRWASIDKVVLAVNPNYLLTSNALYARNGLRIKKIQSMPDKYSTAQINWKTGEFYMYSMKELAIEKYILKNGKFQFSGTVLKNVINCEFTLLPNNQILYFDEKYIPHIYPTQESGFNMDMAYLQNVFVDKEGNLWITSNNGLYNFFNLNFEEYTFGLAKPDNIWSILEDNKHNMWFGSYGWGLWRMDKLGQLKAFNSNFSDWSRQYMGSTRSKDGTLYMPNSAGLTVYKDGKFSNLITGTCLSVYYDESRKQVYYSGYIPVTNVRVLWVGTDNNRKSIAFNKGFTIAIGKDSKGRIRVGSFHGQGYVQGDSVIVTDTVKRPYEGIMSYALDKWGRLWKATTKGVYVEMPDGKEYRFAPQLKGLMGAIWNYHDKYLLIGTGSGMAIALLQNNMLQNPTVWDITYDGGFTGLDTGQNGFFEDHNGDMWVWTSLNVLKFNPDKLVQSQTKYIPPLRVAGITYSTNNTDWESQFFSESNKIKISSDNKFFRIDYIANSISAPKSLRFKYRLIGLSDKWSEAVITKSVSYTNIGFGKYRFEVKCSLDGIKWSSVIQSPEIEITVPFYLRPIAFLFYILVIIALSIHLTKVFTKRKQTKVLQEINRKKLENELQLSTLRSKVIPHFTKNVLSAIGHFAMTDKLKAGHYISVFSKFTGLTLANADKIYVSLDDELEYIQKYLELEKMRFGDRFEFVIVIDKGVDTTTQLPAMTLHTYCDNAIRHGLINKKEKGELTVEIKNANDGVLIQITDNGIGRKRSSELGTQGNGQGIKLIQAQLDFYNQNNNHKITQTFTDMEDENGIALGTKVELYIPNGYVFE